jgi:ribose/xylose/arabinose/galactoside ABC-type transport system permease subunit
VLNGLTAVLLAGIGLGGGAGRIERTLAGVLFLGVMDNGLILLQVPSSWGTIVRGIALLAAVIMVSVRERRLQR